MLGVAATARPDVGVSLKATPLRALFVFGLVMLKSACWCRSAETLVGLNDLRESAGPPPGVAVLLAPDPPSVEVIVQSC